MLSFWNWLNTHTSILTFLVTTVGLIFIWRQIRAAKEQAAAGTRAANAATEQTTLFQEQLELFRKQLEDSRENVQASLKREDYTRRGSVQPVCVLEVICENSKGQGILRHKFRVTNVGLGPACSIIETQEMEANNWKKHPEFRYIADGLPPRGESIFWGGTMPSRYLLTLHFDNAYGEHYKQQWRVIVPIKSATNSPLENVLPLTLVDVPPDTENFERIVEPDPNHE